MIDIIKTATCIKMIQNFNITEEVKYSADSREEKIDQHRIIIVFYIIVTSMDVQEAKKNQIVMHITFTMCMPEFLI